ncbi:VOC family protein [Kineococcus sp. SYSU DK004]|uniref:VOC family protein n=1 Tax=Kineococcus sp. SYSU DK004 TaxID=3383125 RepID=UPI003D7C4804
MTAMDTGTGTGIDVRSVFLPHEDPDASLAFYRDVLGFEVRGDVGYGELRWITVGPPGGAGTSIVLEPPSADPGRTPEEVRTVAAMMAKGTFAGLLLTADDLDAAFERFVAAGADVVQEPVQQDWGVRDCAVRDPAGNLLRVQERPA